MKQHATLENLISPLVTGLGYQWVGLQYLSNGRRATLRIYANKPAGITIEDCAEISRHVNAALSVEALIEESYLLEVSSPGLDCLLFTPEQCIPYIGKAIAVRVMKPIQGKQNFKGHLKRVEGVDLCLGTEHGDVSIPFTDIEEARVVPEW